MTAAPQTDDGRRKYDHILISSFLVTAWNVGKGNRELEFTVFNSDSRKLHITNGGCISRESTRLGGFLLLCYTANRAPLAFAAAASVRLI